MPRYTLNFQDIADDTGLSLSTIKRFFNGGNASLKTAQLIAKHFNLSLDAVVELQKSIQKGKEQ
jgi:cyanate lyase